MKNGGEHLHDNKMLNNGSMNTKYQKRKHEKKQTKERVQTGLNWKVAHNQTNPKRPISIALIYCSQKR